MKRILLTIALALLGCVMICACSDDSGKGYTQITPQEAKQIMDTESGYVILDVRTHDEYMDGHIPGAVLIPDYDIVRRAESELPDKEQLILVYCRSGRRSKLAAEALAELGYTNVMEFGGINDWPYETE
ncbi:MAG: rhodanese-like domain-containing protein [Ruminococcaceae bacterium]|nr:rhodanese-like domain-containing protein [Oscillospiraceae bacterium]